MLGISLATLYRRIEKLGLKESHPGASAPPHDGPEGGHEPRGGGV